MATDRKYLVSFGDSDKYIVSFPGNKEEFENSDKLSEIKKEVCDYLRKTFPTGGFADTVELNVDEAHDSAGYSDLYKTGVDELLKSVKRQVEVMREGKELNNNAPFDNI